MSDAKPSSTCPWRPKINIYCAEIQAAFQADLANGWKQDDAIWPLGAWLESRFPNPHRQPDPDAKPVRVLTNAVLLARRRAHLKLIPGGMASCTAP